MRFHLDEDQSDIIARIVRDTFGLDATSSHELGMDHASDIEQLHFAAREGRCVVTRNTKDFAPLTSHFQEQGLPHAGVLNVPKSMLGENFSTIARAIAWYASLQPDDVIPYLFDYLRPAPEDWRPA